MSGGWSWVGETGSGGGGGWVGEWVGWGKDGFFLTMLLRTDCNAFCAVSFPFCFLLLLCF